MTADPHRQIATLNGLNAAYRRSIEYRLFMLAGIGDL
jgi:hypothetical protein